MKLRNVYLVLAVAGTVLPYWPFVSWVHEHGLRLPLLVQELFSTRVGTFFGLDVIVSAAALFVFIGAERMRHRWIPVVATLLVGVSLGLPLFLYMREGVTSLRWPRRRG